MRLIQDEDAKRLLTGERMLVLVERGGLQYYPAFVGAWPGRIGTLHFSRYLPHPPRWLWGGPAGGMVIFDKSTTTGITLLKLKLFFQEYAPVIIGSLSRQHGRAGANILDLAAEISYPQEMIHIQRVPSDLGGRYLLACDSSHCAEAVQEIVGCPLLTLPTWEDLPALQERAHTQGPMVLDLGGETFERSFLPARLLLRPVVGVTRSPERHADLCLDAGAKEMSLSPALAVRLRPDHLSQMYG